MPMTEHASKAAATKPDNLRFGRFERRVLAAMAVVAFLPAIAALLLGRAVLREVYQVGVNRRVLGTLEQSLEVHHEHVPSLEADFHMAAREVFAWTVELDQVGKSLRRDPVDRR